MQDGPDIWMIAGIILCSFLVFLVVTAFFLIFLFRSGQNRLKIFRQQVGTLVDTALAEPSPPASPAPAPLQPPLDPPERPASPAPADVARDPGTCPYCSAAIAPGERFCGSCGGPLGEPG